NWQAGDLLRPTFWKTRPGDRLQMNAIGVKQQDRSERAAPLLFDHPAQDIENAGKRDAGRDHFEKAFLTGKQRLRSFPFRHLRNRSHVFADLSRFIFHRMSQTSNCLIERGGTHRVAPLLKAESIKKVSRRVEARRDY